jgi:hypothetical protein
MRRHVGGILLLHAAHASARAYASTVAENVNAFVRHSRRPITAVSTRTGFPSSLQGLEFDVLVLHYSLFGIVPYELNERFRDYIASSRAYKVAFFQDEYRFYKERRAFVEENGIQTIYTLIEPRFHELAYGGIPGLEHVVHVLPGYVSDELLEASKAARPLVERTIDVGYRARSVPFYLGAAGQEKTAIAHGFLDRAEGRGLRLDISASQSDRIYGPAWHQYLANCRAVLGVEGGASVFDLEGEVYSEWRRLIAEDPDMTFEEYQQRAETLARWDYRYPSLMLTTRHLEGGSFRCCQVLFPGPYSDILVPDEHYIPLERDFSNVESVLARLADDAEVTRLTDAAHRDLIASGRYHYRHLVREFEDRLEASGVLDRRTRAHVRVMLRASQAMRPHVIDARAAARGFLGRARASAVRRFLVFRRIVLR